MTVTPPSCPPDCLLTFAHFTWAFRALTDEQWGEAVLSGTFDGWLNLVQTPELPAIFFRAFKV